MYVYILQNLKFALRNRKGIEWEGSLMIEAVVVLLGITIAVFIFMILMNTSGSTTNCENSQFMNYASSLVADVQGSQGLCH